MIARGRRKSSKMTPVILQRAAILARKEVASGIYSIQVHAPQVVALGQPGQFVHIRPGAGTDPLLRRPLSLFSRDLKGGVLGLLFRVVGKGTQVLSQMKTGQSLDLMGPLGRGFSVPSWTRETLLVAGGLGVAPLFFLAQDLVQRKLTVRFLLGARRREELLCRERLEAMGVKLMVSTDDGSEGFCGLVSELLETVLRRDSLDPEATLLYATGPEPMLTRVASLARTSGFDAQFSLERHMACGMGVCLGCVVRCLSRDGDQVYRRVCTDGPVFHLEELLVET
jgi:dihydroorotate dehydrogenase electron transfer subunit